MIYRIGAKEYRSFHVLSVFQAPVNLVDQVKMIFPFAVTHAWTFTKRQSPLGQ